MEPPMKSTKFISTLLLVASVAVCFISCNKKSTRNEVINATATVTDIANNYSYAKTEDGAGIIIKKYIGKETSIIVPEKIETLPVVEIGEGAFDAVQATTITLPNTVKKIDQNAFSYTSISKFIMPDSVTECDPDIFTNCDNLTEVHLSNGIEDLIGEICAEESHITKANIPANIKRMSNTFSFCHELTELEIPSTITSIEFGAYTWDKHADPAALVWTKEGTEYSAMDDPLDSQTFFMCSKLPEATKETLKKLGYKG